MSEAMINRIANTYGEWAGELAAYYGSTVPRSAAASIARDHGTSLFDLMQEGLKCSKAGAVKTVALLETLGY